MKGTAQTVDDGAYSHLREGVVLPEMRLAATTGESLDIVAPSAITVIFLYPMTGAPGQPLPDGWLELPGAFGCTAESCGYRDLVEEFARLDTTVYGVSTQTTSQQREFTEREHINYPLLSDSEHRLVDALRLPLFQVAGHPPRIKRATLIVDRDRVVRETNYPVPDPAADAAHALAAVTKRFA
ncbi:MAG: redoxin domain-containing protein [Actinobacteria bacterium]|nr:redoxin domain-containing protein [Actinomycetota bacterium]